MRVTKLFYDFFIRIYPLSIRLAAPFKPKARLWVEGRSDLFKRLKEEIDPNAPLIWMHCSSLGEFEQGRPVLEKLKKENQAAKVLLTFFSPSGYEVRKDYKGADHIFYLPADSNSNAKKFFEITKPKLLLFIKYEFWYYYLAEAKTQNIPLLLISGIFRKDQPFFKWYGSFHRSMLSAFHHFFVQNTLSASLLSSIGLTKNVTVSGDTRFDRVIEIAENFQPIAAIEKFVNDAPVVVAGSTWSEDDKELSHFANSNSTVKFIIAPHHISSDRIKECKKLYKDSILYSELLQEFSTEQKNILIIDNIGMLSTLYKYATICFIGGAFGEDGVHNVLEAAVYGKPVVYGPVFEKYFEAVELVQNGGAITVNNPLDLEKQLNLLLQQGQEYHQAAAAAKNYVYNNKGATEKVLNYIYENRLLTN